MGENVKKFEKHFANYFGSKYCVMVNSGSSANLLIVAALTTKKNMILKRGRGFSTGFGLEYKLFTL